MSHEKLLNSNWTAAYEDSIDGLLVLDILQPSLSHTVLDESDPVQIATIVGSIGGAWGKEGITGVYPLGVLPHGADDKVVSYQLEPVLMNTPPGVVESVGGLKSAVLSITLYW